MNADVVTFQNREASDNVELVKMSIIKASTDIKNEIKQIDNNTTFYPTVEEIKT